jgi:hypothetical protein
MAGGFLARMPPGVGQMRGQPEDFRKKNQPSTTASNCRARLTAMNQEK